MNYYNYFTEIEEHFQRKRGAQILLSPLDWALIASWHDAAIPLAAVVTGIDDAFEKFESGRRRDTQRYRSLLYCAPAVLAAAEAMAANNAGAAPPEAATAPRDHGFNPEQIQRHLAAAAAKLQSCDRLDPASPAVAEILATLDRLRQALAGAARPSLEELDRVLTVLDEKLLIALQQAVPVDEMVQVRVELTSELAPYRRKLRAEQLAMIERQFIQRKLLERAHLPRLSLFYMQK